MSVVNPLRVKGFAQTQLTRNKTDRADAKLIALFCQTIVPERWNPEADHIQALQAFVRRLDAFNGLAVSRAKSPRYLPSCYVSFYTSCNSNN